MYAPLSRSTAGEVRQLYVHQPPPAAAARRKRSCMSAESSISSFAKTCCSALPTKDGSRPCAIQMPSLEKTKAWKSSCASSTKRGAGSPAVVLGSRRRNWESSRRSASAKRATPTLVARGYARSWLLSCASRLLSWALSVWGAGVVMQGRSQLQERVVVFSVRRAPAIGRFLDSATGR